MHIVVCVKQVPNPEAAFSMLKVDEQAKKVVPAAGLQLVMSPFDEQALEAALRVRESLGQAKITAVSVGPDSARNTLKHALAMGADEAVLVSDAVAAGTASVPPIQPAGSRSSVARDLTSTSVGSVSSRAPSINSRSSILRSVRAASSNARGGNP